MPESSSAAPSPHALAIETHELTRRFGHLTAVDRLDLVVAAGTLFGLLGSNGAGKSTAIRMLITLLPPTSGRARVAGFDIVDDAADVRRHIGYVSQMLSADSMLTGRENLDLSGKLYGLGRSERRQRVDEALTFMGLAGHANVLVRNYSGGMIRRLEIAQSMLHEPDVLFLDEPTVGLDPVARHSVWDRLRELRARTAATILLTTHDMEEAELLCDTISIMHQGRVVVSGTPQNLRAIVGEGATLDDVFLHYTGGSVEEGGRFRDVARTRRTAQRLG